MNGLGLLVALAMLGVDVGWETTSSGRAYTIRIESVLIEKLGAGSAIESVVDKNDRALLRKFRVVVGPKNAQTDRVTPGTANEVEYGWRPNETGGIDYYVQISRERLETLARGIPLECEVHPDVPQIDKIYVFVGDTKLPRELPPGVRGSTTPPRDLNTIDPRGNVAPVSGTDTNSGAPRYGNATYGPQGNTPTNATDPNRYNGYGTQNSQGNVNNNQTYGPAPSSGYRDPATSATNNYGQYVDNTLPVPPLDTSRPADYGYNYNPNQYAPTQQAYSPAPAQTAALPAPQQYASPAAPTFPVATQQQTPSAPTATSPSMDALAALIALQQKQLETPKTPEVAEAKPKSSKPLILTTMALFASIGANAYLGWLAWSFFWRFRDAASDLSRARSNAFPAGSVAGH